MDSACFLGGFLWSGGRGSASPPAVASRCSVLMSQLHKILDYWTCPACLGLVVDGSVICIGFCIFSWSSGVSHLLHTAVSSLASVSLKRRRCQNADVEHCFPTGCVAHRTRSLKQLDAAGRVERVGASLIFRPSYRS